MKRMFTATLTATVCAAFVGLMLLSQSAIAQQKTAKVCNAEWAANKAAIKAAGKTKRVFVAECRGVAVTAPAPARKPAAALPATGQFTTEAEAKASCPTDTVVWINPKSRVYHAGGSRSYGTTKQGAYMCEKDSLEAGFRASRIARRAAI
jgi:hypothetical protein